MINEAIKRIRRMEEVFDTLRSDPSRTDLLGQLTAYYQGGQWLRDYELDEQGLLPQDLKRGVLSQDAVYDFLNERGTIMENQHIIFIEEEDQPYSDIVVTEGKYLFLSGLVSEELSTRDEAYGSIEFETNRILDNLKVILEQYGSDMDHVVRVDVLLSKWKYKDAMNAEYVKHFKRAKLPARICFGDVAIAGECKVEMAVIATKK